MNPTVMVLRALLLSTLLLAPWALAADAEVAGYEHWVEGTSGHDGKAVKLYLWEKRLADREPGSFMGSRKVVLLTHGAGTPARVAFDLQPASAPGQYSLMDYLARRGFDVFALDYQNYGRSDKHPCGLCVTSEVAARDVAAAVDFIRKYRGIDKVHLLGWSWGSVVNGIYATQQPEKVDRLVLYAPPVHTGPRGVRPTDEFRVINAESMRNLFEAEATDAAAFDTWSAETAKWGPTAANGVMLDLNTKMPLTDPRNIKPPTLIILGELDRATPVSQDNLKPYFEALPNSDKRFVVVPGAGHTLTVQKPRERFYQEVASWFGAK